MAWQGMGNGEVDVIIENWGHPDLEQKYITKQKTAQDAGPNGNIGVIGWYVPPGSLWILQGRTWFVLYGGRSAGLRPGAGRAGPLLAGRPAPRGGRCAPAGAGPAARPPGEPVAEAAVALLRAAFPDDSGEVGCWPDYARLLPHPLAVCEHAERLDIAGEQVGWLVHRASDPAVLLSDDALTDAAAFAQRRLALRRPE
jgi:hypothetical protein